MEQIQKAKSISIWIFIIPFVAVNTCLIITTQLHFLIDGPYRIYSTFPYIDGGVSISRTARYFPTYLIFKPAMFLTTYFLIKYWIYSANIVNHFEENHKYRKKILFFGIASAIALTIHAIFLGIKFDNDLYKLFRRVIMLSFIVFEIVAQTYLVITLYSFRQKLENYICNQLPNIFDSCENNCWSHDADYGDADGDGVADCLESEVCDGLDNDGDTLVDE